MILSTLEKLTKASSVADYKSKVPEEVGKANLEKLQGSQVVAGRVVKAIQTLKSL